MIKMKCPNGCGWEGSPAEYAGHFDVCPSKQGKWERMGPPKALIEPEDISIIEKNIAPILHWKLTKGDIGLATNNIFASVFNAVQTAIPAPAARRRFLQALAEGLDDRALLGGPKYLGFSREALKDNFVELVLHYYNEP